jgi:hypothetical protein
MNEELIKITSQLGESYKEPMSFSQIAEKLERTPEGIRLIANKAERIMKYQAIRKKIGKDSF